MAVEHDPEAGLLPAGTGSDAQPALVDWNGQGRLDLLVTSRGGPAGRKAFLYRLEQGAEARGWRVESVERLPSLDGLSLLSVVPSEDQQRRFDLVGMEDGRLVYLANQGDAGQPSFAERTPLRVDGVDGADDLCIVSLLAEDWDGDEQVELVLGLESNPGYWPDSPAVPSGLQVGHDQQGVPLGWSSKGRRWLGEEPKGRLVACRLLRTAEGVSLSRPEPIALDLATGPTRDRGLCLVPVCWRGRGSWEILQPDTAGQLLLYRNFGGQRPPEMVDSRPLLAGSAPLIMPEDRTNIVAGDLDRDTRPELVYGRADGRLFAIHAAARESTEPPAPLLTRPGTLWLGGDAVISVGDLDGDGDLDIVAGDAAGRLWLAEDRGASGSHRYGAPLELDAQGAAYRLTPRPDRLAGGPAQQRLGYACPTLVDWKRNGRTDLIVSGVDGFVRFFRNNGGPAQPRFDEPEPVRMDGQPLLIPPQVRPAAVSWDQDTDYPDLIALDFQGLLCLYPRVEVMDVAPPIPLVDRSGRCIRLDGGFELAGRCNLWAGPWTGSGRNDLLVGLPRSSRFVIPGLIGKAVTRFENLPTVLLLENMGNDVLMPRLLRDRQGRPIIAGCEGCSPCGADWSGSGQLDLVVGTDEGTVLVYPREQLCW